MAYSPTYKDAERNSFRKNAHILSPYSIACMVFLLSLLLYGRVHAQQQDKEPLKVNLGPHINSQFDEVYPLISPDGKTLYFVRKKHPENILDTSDDIPDDLRHKDDIWYSTRDANGDWTEAVNIGKPLNNPSYNYVCGVLPDNNTLLLGNNYYPGGKMDVGVSMAKRIAGGWGFPENLHFARYSNTQSYAEYTISPHANVLILSVQPEDTYYSPSLGMRDLYVSVAQDDGTWSAPLNIGGQVNTEYQEITPYLASDGKTMYFSSNRPGGLGKNDVYITRRLDETWTNWSPPQNVGYPVNTPNWDAYFTVPGSENYGYVVSTTSVEADAPNPGYGGSDIFRVKLSPTILPYPIMIVYGKVLDDLGNTVPATIEYERLSDTARMGTATIDPATGDYKIALPAGEVYGFHAEADGYYAVHQNVDLKNLSSYEEIRRDITLIPLKKGTTVRLNNIFFEFNSAKLLPQSRTELDKLVQYLRTHSSIRIELAGHTDSVGSDTYNEKLSHDRAVSVKNYLVNEGIQSDRVVAKGYGKTRPIAPNDTEEGRQQNRRVEFTIL